MKHSSHVILFVILAVSGCHQADKPKTESVKPAKVQKLPVETDLATITLTEDANRRLGGQAVVPSGRSIIVSSPLAGIVARANRKPLPNPGSQVAIGTPLLSVKPLLSSERDVMTPAEQVQLVGARANLMAAQTVAAGDVDRGNAEVEGAQIAFDRATKLFADRAGARRAVDDAEAQLNIAKSNLAAAKEREKQLSKLVKMLEVQSPDGEAASLPMTTPIGGLVNRIDVSEGQTIGAGAVLFEVMNTDTIWISVPVFVGQLHEVQKDQVARLVSLSGESLPSNVFAKPIAAPPTADTMTSSADLYYEVDNRELQLRRRIADVEIGNVADRSRRSDFVRRLRQHLGVR